MTPWTPPVNPNVAAKRPGRGQTMLLVGVGGAIGTAVRSALETTSPAAAGTWPWTTFWINITGAFVLACLLETLSVLGPDAGWLRRIRLGVGTGVLGGYTTYSTFMVETARLGQADEYLLGFGYAAASLVVGFIAAWAGMAGVNTLNRRRHGLAR